MLRDVAQPSLWSDSQIVALLNEAEILFARHTHMLRSTDPAVAEIETEQGKGVYKLHPAVIHVVDIWNDDGYSLRSVNRKKLSRAFSNGKPSMYTADSGSSAIRLSPVPDDAYTLTLLVAHKPTRAMNRARDVPQIPEEYHRDLCLYVAYRAILHNGPEGSDTTSAEEFRAAWKTRLRDVKREVYQERMGSDSFVRPNAAFR